jgi:hypothetical protein
MSIHSSANIRTFAFHGFIPFSFHFLVEDVSILCTDLSNSIQIGRKPFLQQLYLTTGLLQKHRRNQQTIFFPYTNRLFLTLGTFTVFTRLINPF